MYKRVAFLGEVKSKRSGITKDNKPWVSLTIIIPGHSRVEGEPPPTQYHSCYCVGSPAKVASDIEVGDLAVVKGSEELTNFMLQDRVKFSTSVKVEHIEKFIEGAPKRDKVFDPPPFSQQAEEDEDLPF